MNKVTFPKLHFFSQLDNSYFCHVLRNPEKVAIGSWVQVPLGTLGTQAATGNPEKVAIGSWVQVPLGTLGTQAATGNPEKVAIGSWV